MGASLLLDVLDLFHESAQQDKPIPKPSFALAHIYSNTDCEYFTAFHKPTLLWGFLSQMWEVKKYPPLKEAFMAQSLMQS